MLGASAAATAAAFAISWVGSDAGPPASSDLGGSRASRVLGGATEAVRARPWSAGVLLVVGARNAILGALDVLLVLLAFESLDMGAGGAGVLNALVGVGALLSTLVAAMVVRRARLAPWLAGSVAGAAVLCTLLGLTTSLPVAVVVLPPSARAPCSSTGWGACSCSGRPTRPCSARCSP